MQHAGGGGGEERFESRVGGVTAVHLYRTLDAILDYAILTLDPEGRVTTWNAGASILKGYARDEAIGLHFSSFYVPEDVTSGKPERELARAIEDGRFEEEGWRVRKDGTRFWANVNITPIYDDGRELVGFCKVTRDLTLRHQLEERVQAAVEASPTGMVMVGLDGTILLANARMVQLFGYPLEQLLAMNIDDLVPSRFRGSHPAHRARFSKESGSRPMGVGRDLHALRSDGSEFPVEIGINPMRTTAGPCVMASVVDITERKRVADELRRSNLELEHFAAIASHDLQEPLRMVSSFVQLLAQRYGGQLDERADRYIQFALDGAQRMQQLIDDLLEYSRASASTRPLVSVDLQTVAADVLHTLRTQIAEEQATVVVGELPKVMGDEPQLRRVLQNLVGNALKFRDGARPPEITIDAQRLSRMWSIRVQDNGIGFSGEFAERIFEMFQRLHGREAYQGSGIGLTTVKRVVERHGGTVTAHSSPGQGATFTFTVPAVAE